MYNGYLEVGGNEIVNNARTIGYTQSGDCAVGWLVCAPCPSLGDALGHAGYSIDNISDAPWYDASDETTSRFYGVMGLTFENLSDSTRTATVAEGITDGGVVGIVRHAVRQVRVRAVLSAHGEDALEAGLSWLDAALQPEVCSSHGNSCGSTDACFFVACPPERALVPDFTPWEVYARNLFTNPSFEATSAAVEIRRNRMTNPNSVVGAEGTNVLGWTGVTVTGGQPIITGASTYSINVSVATGNWVTGRIRLMSPTGGNLTVSARETLGGSFGSQPIIQSKAITLAPGVVQEVTVGGQVTGPSSDGWRLNISSWVPTDMRLQASTMENTTVPAPDIFSGNGYSDTDFTASWVGAVNGSESILTALGSPGTSTGLAQRWASQHWSMQGVRSVRVRSLHTAVGSGYLDFFGATGLTVASAAGRTFTIMATARTAEPRATAPSLQMIDKVGAAPYRTVSAVAPNLVGVHPLKITFTVQPGATEVYFRLYNNAVAGQPDVWFDNLAVIEGEYLGEFFDGNTPDNETQRYAWAGIDNGSVSVYEGRNAIDRPQTDEEYEQIVERYDRHLHGVTCISGPIIEQKLERGDAFGYVVEFILAAATPFVFSDTREIDLGPTDVTVVQDVPFNLVKAPSAEFTAPSFIDIAKNWSTNPSAETNVTGWDRVADGTIITTAMLSTVAQSNELKASGTYSAKITFTATTTASAQTAAWLGIQQEVTLPTDPWKDRYRYSINMWATANNQTGSATLGNIVVTAFWRAGGSTLRTDAIGTMTASGGAASLSSILPPAGATSVIVRAQLNMTAWTSGNVVRFYADALAVTTP